MTGRAEGWEERLYAVVEEWRDRPFQWGSADCAGFAIACVAAVRGHDVIGEVPPYASRAGARKALKAMGAAEIDDVMARHFAEIPPSLAQRGDIGVAVENGLRCAAVNTGMHWMGQGEAGLVRLPPPAITRAFRV